MLAPPILPMGGAGASPASRLLLYSKVGTITKRFLWVTGSGSNPVGHKFGHFRYLWQNWEGGRVSSLVSSLDRKTLISSMRSQSDDNGEQKSLLHAKTEEMVNYLKATKGTHDGWASEF